MRARVHVTLKPGVLDPQGEAVRHALGTLGFDGVGEVRDRQGDRGRPRRAAIRGRPGAGRRDVREAARQHDHRELRRGDRMSFRAGVLVFPGSNCDRDLAVALRRAGAEVAMVWHKETAPAGRPRPRRASPAASPSATTCAAARSPRARRSCARSSAFAEAGGHVLGVCNGFQVLIEAGLLPGALMRNAGLKFVCAPVAADGRDRPTAPSPAATARGETIRLPIAHHDGNYFADAATLARLEAEDRVAFRYAANPNGSAADIAGILSENRRVLGLMPHPERAVDPAARRHRRRAALRGPRRGAGSGRLAGRLSGAPAGTSIGADEPGSRAAAPDRASGPFLDACRPARVGARHGAGDLGEPHLPDPRLQRGPEHRRDGARDALRRLDPEHDAAPFGGAAAAFARPDPDPRAALGRVRRRRGAAGELPGGDRRRLDLPARRRGPHRGGQRRAAARAVRRRQGLFHPGRRPTPARSSRSSRTTTAPTASTTPAASCRTTSCSASSWSPSTSACTRRAGGGRGSRSW